MVLLFTLFTLKFQCNKIRFFAMLYMKCTMVQCSRVETFEIFKSGEIYCMEMYCVPNMFYDPQKILRLCEWIFQLCVPGMFGKKKAAPIEISPVCYTLIHGQYMFLSQMTICRNFSEWNASFNERDRKKSSLMGKFKEFFCCSF